MFQVVIGFFYLDHSTLVRWKVCKSYARLSGGALFEMSRFKKDLHSFNLFFFLRVKLSQNSTTIDSAKLKLQF